jgi:DNA repair exonuclease SbcCD ATPase subunit
MRIIDLEVSGFRGFTDTARFDLAADAVIIIGGNGQGKTSFFDSILWAITGRVPRLRVDDNGLRSLFSASGEMRVLLRLADRRGTHYELTRSSDGYKQNVRFKVGENTFTQDAARLKLIESLWSGTTSAGDIDTSLGSAYVRSVYLQQDLVRQFIDADDEQERFTVVSELVGVGKVTDLQLQLERSKMAWVKAYNQRSEELRALSQKLSVAESQLAKLGSESASAGITDRWSDWWKNAGEVTGAKLESPAVESLEAATTLDTAIRRLQAVFQANERNKQTAAALFSEISERKQPPQLGNPEQFARDIQQDRSLIDSLREQLASLQSLAADQRRMQVELREQHESFRAFAQLALRHLGERCPVCEQTYDIDATRNRLRGVLQQQTLPLNTADSQAAISSIAEKLANAERALAAKQASFDAQRQAHAAYVAWTASRDQRLNQLGVRFNKGEEAEPTLNVYIQDLDSKSKNLQSLMHAGEQLALSLAQATEQARKQELHRDVVTLRENISQITAEVNAQQDTERLAAQILEGLREASTEVVKNQLDRIEPLLQRIYARIDVHPAFRNVKFLTRFSNRRGRLFTSILDRVTDISSQSPAVVLSSSQMNALAVSIFLSLNLGLTALPLEAVLLDDPLQSLDDVNLLGLVDLLRRTKDRRQLVVSTHDARFGSLLERKLRAVSKQQRTTVIEFSGWQRSGPVYTQRDVSRDDNPMRIAVA